MQVRGKCVTDPAYEDVNSAFERALVFMHKVSGITGYFKPRIKNLYTVYLWK